MYLSFGSASLENPDSDNRVQGFGEDVQDGWAPGWVDRECKFYFSRYRGQQAQLDITHLHQICHLCPVGNWYLRWPRAVRIWHWKVPQGGSKATLSNGSGSQQYSFMHSSLRSFLSLKLKDTERYLLWRFVLFATLRYKFGIFPHSLLSMDSCLYWVHCQAQFWLTNPQVVFSHLSLFYHIS